jgi:hypothetical protein
MQNVLTRYFFETARKRRRTESERPLFFDLFCGCGGASEGARLAGYDVALAVDICPKALHSHAVSHPAARHLLCDVVKADIPLPSDPAIRYHVHLSPPCQTFSIAGLGKYHKDTAHRKDMLAVVEYCLRLVLESSAESWSLENVYHIELVELLETFPNVAWTKINCADFGVPQRRIRIFAGPPSLVRRVAARSPDRHVSAREALSLPPELRFMRFGESEIKIRGDGRIRHRSIEAMCRSLDEPSFSERSLANRTALSARRLRPVKMRAGSR